MCRIRRFKCALECLDCSVGILSDWIASWLHNADKDHLVIGNSELLPFRQNSRDVGWRLNGVNRGYAGHMTFERTAQELRPSDQHIELLERSHPEMWNDRQFPPEITRVENIIAQQNALVDKNVRQCSDGENDKADAV